jgi:hypothetical protein
VIARKIAIAVLIIGCFYVYSVFAQGIRKENKMKKTATGQTPFGVLEFLHWNHPWNNYKYPDEKSINKVVSLMKNAGVSIVRMDFLWDEIEPSQGSFIFDKYDKIIGILAKNNIEILGILEYSASWANSCGKWNCPPKDNALYVKYAQAVVKHYRGKITYWEIWNEPDSATYWSAQDSLKSYCLLLKDAYTAIKEIAPECQVLNGGFANAIDSINHLYDNGAKGYFDILNIHIFESPLHEGSIKRVMSYPKLARKIMERNGDGNKKIWVTEIGCPGVKKGLKASNWWMGENPDEEKQAFWVRDIFTSLVKDPSIEKVFWAFFRDCDQHWDNGVDYFGLVRWDYSLKPSFAAYKEASHLK